MARTEGNDPEDWSYLQRPEDFGRDMRLALFPYSIIRGVVTWILGRDPVAERRQRRLAEDQRRHGAGLEAAEQDAYRHLGETDPGDRDR